MCVGFPGRGPCKTWFWREVDLLDDGMRVYDKSSGVSKWVGDE